MTVKAVTAMNYKMRRHNMDNEIYCRTIVPLSKSSDGETPSQIIVTKEVNCYLVWMRTAELGYHILCTFSTMIFNAREDAIEYAVDLAKKETKNELPTL